MSHIRFPFAEIIWMDGIVNIITVISIAVVIATIGILGPAFETWAGDIKSCITAPGTAACPFPAVG